VTTIENLKPGDRVATIKIPGLEVDVPYRAQYQWLSHRGMRGTIPTVGRVASVKFGEHTGFVVINRRIKATPEHPFLMRRGDEWGFSSAELLKKGDYLIGERLAEEMVESVERIDAPTRTVAIHIPGTNTFSAEGVWVHNDMPATAHSSGSGSSSSGSGSSTGSGSSSSSGSSASKSSGSSMSSSSSSGSGSGSGSSSHSSGGPGGTYSI
jgi:intein/homing endonuclease